MTTTPVPTEEETVRATVLKGTIEHLMKELTPERMQVFIEALLGKTLKDITTDYRIQNEIRDQMKPYLIKILADPLTQALIQKAVQTGVDKAIEGIPTAVSKEITDATVKHLQYKLGTTR